ncbi:ipis-1-like [Dermacentor variabilis]|uniref:ipis-1-like n=1 Tax=Dermacentor variabilis TaxID=34621 RepID=UPI003F5B0F1C
MVVVAAVSLHSPSLQRSWPAEHQAIAVKARYAPATPGTSRFPARSTAPGRCDSSRCERDLSPGLYGSRTPGRQYPSLDPRSRRAMTTTALGVCLLKLAINLYTQLHSLNKEGNIAYSTYSVGSALSMALAGAHGDTAKQLAAVLHVTESDKIHEQSWYSNASFQLANLMYSERELKVRTEFDALLEAYFRGRIKSVDFKENPESVRKEVNEWVLEITYSKIKELLPPGSVTKDTVFIIANAIYFKSMWENQFHKRDTKKQTFHLDSRSNTTVEMMFKSEAPFKVGRSKELKATLVEIPYIGGIFSMVILVPDEVEGLSFLEGQLSESHLRSALESLAMKGNVGLTLPKFKLEYSASLKEALSALGAKLLFSDSADFSGIFENGMASVSQVFHKTFIQVAEEGTEPAAATEEAGTGSGGPSYNLVTRVVVDRPFMFLIRKNEGNVILFMGSVRKL